MHPIGFQLGRADCIGSDELGATFKYNRFRCAVVSKYPPYFKVRVAMYVTGPTTFRWMII
jgi:hypothetical protein